MTPLSKDAIKEFIKILNERLEFEYDKVGSFNCLTSESRGRIDSLKDLKSEMEKKL